MYNGTTIVSIPIASPAIALPRRSLAKSKIIPPAPKPQNLPTKIIGTLTPPACIADPIKKITTARRIDLFRPMRSAIGPFAREPNHAAEFCQVYESKVKTQGAYLKEALIQTIL
jgi:hypothetical protein